MEKRTEEILELLRSKHRCLDRLLAATRDFLATPLAELVTESGNDVGALATYESTRATIIRTIELHDGKISAMITDLPLNVRSPEFIDEIRAEVLRNERAILAIFNADDVVFRKLGDAQAQITKLIHENRKSRDILGRFKSAQASTGEGMDRTL